VTAPPAQGAPGRRPTGRARGGSSWLDGGCGQGFRRCADDRVRL